MWYLNLMLPLLAKVKAADKQKAEDFLNKFFKSIRKEIYLSEEIPVASILHVIENAYTTFENAEDNSLSLSEFTNFIFLRTLLYIKVSDEYAIWNADFLPVFSQVESHLGWQTQIDELELDFESGKKTLKTESRFNNQEKALIYLLNQQERDLLQTLDYNFDLNLFHLESIFVRHGSKEIVRAFIQDCLTLHNHDAEAFNAMAGFLTLSNFIQRMKYAANLYNDFGYIDESSTLSMLASSIELQEHALQAEFKAEKPDIEKINGLKREISAVLHEQLVKMTTALSNNLQAMRIFYHAFAPQNFLFSALMQNVETRIKKREATFTKEKIEATFMADIAEKCLDLMKVESEIWENRLSNKDANKNENDPNIAFQRGLIKALKIILLEKSSIAIMRQFVNYFKDVPPFEQLVEHINQELTHFAANPMTKAIEKIREFAERQHSPHRENLLTFVAEKTAKWESFFYKNGNERNAPLYEEPLAEAFYEKLLTANAWDLLSNFSNFVPSLSEDEETRSIFAAVINRNKRNLKIFTEHEVVTAIDQMADFGNTATSARKKEAIEKLVPQLRVQWQKLCFELIKPEPDDSKLQAMKSEFVDLLRSENELMNQHRDPFWQIVANFLLALTGIGALAIAGKTLYSGVKHQKLSINSCLFFAKTASQKNIESVEEKIISVTA
ncbi:hypothetical protein [Legionella clemsonensis]|uniref:Uncharacterized protein n=1 Tax=Legionella clemsonensis TaxID=1867846 RepID=A0A222P556_9GAMM|nr:hypothetical protein [Legionella clemsonensis]ASQ46976.1 hypothetical protein clem_12200 [Legionella clemsonensis]